MQTLTPIKWKLGTHNSSLTASQYHLTLESDKYLPIVCIKSQRYVKPRENHWKDLVETRYVESVTIIVVPLCGKTKTMEI